MIDRADQVAVRWRWPSECGTALACERPEDARERNCQFVCTRAARAEQRTRAQLLIDSPLGDVGFLSRLVLFASSRVELQSAAADANDIAAQRNAIRAQ